MSTQVATRVKNHRYVLVGDGHGNHEIVHQAVSWAHTKQAQAVLLGDLTDSPHRTTRDQLRLLHLTLRELNYGTICLWGNHDLSYLFPNRFRCSGYSRNKQNRFVPLYRKLWRHDNFRPFLWLDNEHILLTHAGLAPALVPDDKSAVAYLQSHSPADLVDHDTLLHPGRCSNGDQPVGGITWLRKEESEESLPGITQVVGHTPHEEIHHDGPRDTWYIDTLDASRSILMIDQGEITVVPYIRYAES